MRYFNILLLGFISFIFSTTLNASVVLEDSFVGADGTALDGRTPNIGDVTWHSHSVGSAGLMHIQSNRAQLHANATDAQDSIYADVTNLYPTILNNAGTISWGIQVNELNFNPSNAYNWAFVIGATQSDFLTNGGGGNGYVLTTHGALDVLMFGHFTNGLKDGSNDTGWDNVTPILIAESFATPFNAQFSIRLDYEVLTGTWKLYGENDPTIDPNTLTTLLGSVTDSTYTNNNLPYIGLAFDHSSHTDRFIDINRVTIGNTSPSPTLTYSDVTFFESYGNDGSINNTSPITISLQTDQFTGLVGEDFVETGKIEVTNPQ